MKKTRTGEITPYSLGNLSNLKYRYYVEVYEGSLLHILCYGHACLIHA